MVAASGSLVLATGIGGVFGPLLSGGAMSAFGATGFFGFLLVAHVLLGLFALYRMRQRAPAENQEQAAAIYLTQSSQVATASAFEGQGETDD
jgi:hypothetical protein